MTETANLARPESTPDKDTITSILQTYELNTEEGRAKWQSRWKELRERPERGGTKISRAHAY